MKNDFVLVFDIGSSKIRAMVAKKGVNNTFIIKNHVDMDYDGFYEGRFLDREKLSLIFSQMLTDLDYTLGKGEEKVYIGVPSEFSSVVSTSAFINFGERRKIKQSDIDSMFYSAGEKAKGERVEIVSVNPISKSTIIVGWQILLEKWQILSVVNFQSSMEGKNLLIFSTISLQDLGFQVWNTYLSHLLRRCLL